MINHEMNSRVTHKGRYPPVHPLVLFTLSLIADNSRRVVSNLSALISAATAAVAVWLRRLTIQQVAVAVRVPVRERSCWYLFGRVSRLFMSVGALIMNKQTFNEQVKGHLVAQFLFFISAPLPLSNSC